MTIDSLSLGIGILAMIFAILMAKVHFTSAKPFRRMETATGTITRVRLLDRIWRPIVTDPAAWWSDAFAKRAQYIGVTYVFTPGSSGAAMTSYDTGSFFALKNRGDRMIQKYTLGQKVTVYYDPNNPSYNEIFRTRWTWILPLGGLIGIPLIIYFA